MANFDNSPEETKQVIFEFLTNIMADKGITQYRLAQLTGISEAVLSRNLNESTEMSVITLLKICDALELRPYFIDKSVDLNELLKKTVQNI